MVNVNSLITQAIVKYDMESINMIKIYWKNWDNQNELIDTASSSYEARDLIRKYSLAFNSHTSRFKLEFME